MPLVLALFFFVVSAVTHSGVLQMHQNDLEVSRVFGGWSSTPCALTIGILSSFLSTALLAVLPVLSSVPSVDKKKENQQPLAQVIVKVLYFQVSLK